MNLFEIYLKKRIKKESIKKWLIKKKESDDF